MTEILTELFENIGTKAVTKTDKDKGAFVPNADQKDVLTAAGFEPGQGGENATTIHITVLFEASEIELETSYYSSMRQDPSRIPESRMGRDFVRWMERDDSISLAHIGGKVFAWKNGPSNRSFENIASRVAKKADRELLIARAKQVKGKPERQAKTLNDFKRNAAVVVGALSRGNGNCEMPNCTSELFKKDDGSTFLEVHHIIPLAEDGDDTLINAAALCPMCHRELHYGAKRFEKREVLKVCIEEKEK